MLTARCSLIPWRGAYRDAGFDPSELRDPHGQWTVGVAAQWKAGNKKHNVKGKMRGQKGYLSSDSAEHTIHHEIGHALYDPPDNFMAQVHQDLAREKVSRYAAMNPKEFVSEVYAGMQAGREFSECTDFFTDTASPELPLLDCTMAAG